MLERLGLARIFDRQIPLLGHAYTLLVVMVGWVFFRSDSIHGAFDYLKMMAGFGFVGEMEFYPDMYLNREVLLALVLAVFGAMPLRPLVATAIAQVTLVGHNVKATYIFPLINISYLGMVFLVSASYLAAGTYNPFIYFRF